jgi:hypothetical protein
MNKIYLYFAKPIQFEAIKEVNNLAAQHDTSAGMAACVFLRLEMDRLAEFNRTESRLDSIFGMVFQRFIQAPSFEISCHYEGNLLLPLLMVDFPKAIHRTTGEVLTLTMRQWSFIGECLEDEIGLEFLEARDAPIQLEEVMGDIKQPIKQRIPYGQELRAH